MTDVEKIERAIDALSPAARFRLVADLLERKQDVMALTVATKTLKEMGTTAQARPIPDPCPMPSAEPAVAVPASDVSL